jgi:pimeloyl-ACP methyl ester carboxylesterase
VFIPPWPKAALPAGWAGPLDRHGIIYVSAANSGNNTNVMDRRMPLALLEVENIRKRYPLDPSRIYAGGMSGGSRVALHLALAYPDVFRGVLLNAGSDPIGQAPLFLPPAALFAMFQTSVRVVYLTGAYDAAHLQDDLRSRQSLRNWCVFDVQSITSPRQGHEVANAPDLARALDTLDRRRQPDAAQLASCRAGIGAALESRLAKAQAELAQGDIHGARAQLEAIDRDYGGVASAGVLKLQGELDRHH